MRSTRTFSFREFGLRLLALCLCWWAITEGDLAALPIGLPAIAIALLLCSRMPWSPTLRLTGFLRFLPIFLWRSLAGGIDVATRALTPRMRLAPSLVEYRTSLAAGLPRVVFANVISLLPGTLSAELNDDVLCLHLLFDAAVDETELGRLEVAVARLFA